MGDRAAARKDARRALERFPDIEADIVVFPSFVNELYGQLREEMYGSLSITDPEGCSVFLNGDHIGDTPLTLSLVRAREYHLVVSKPGFHEYTDSISINPSERHNFTISMKSQRNKRWWLYRISPVVLSLIIGGIVYAQNSGDGGEPAPEPLPGPPAPPAW
jgi:hypothetical protein